MFGTQRDFKNRIAEYQSSLVGIKHLHQLSPMRPKPNRPITVHATTSGGIAYNSVRCWMNVNGEETTFKLTPSESIWNRLEWRYVRHWHGEIPSQSNGATGAL